MPALPLGPIFGWDSVRIGGLFARWQQRRGKPLPKEVLSELGLPLRTDVRKVNEWVNHHITYLEDIQDNWQNPADTLSRRTGDCEDYVLLKRALLAAQGLVDDDMVFLLVKDLILRCDHALLLVRFGPAWLFLDQRTDRLQTVDKPHDYTPVLAYNNHNTWTFGHRKG